ncbi:MAG: uracil-DNA glycosylase [Planctomycetes bacterium]|nr:uracil-DNA glycosylase [Planctomycetota bacterium]
MGVDFLPVSKVETNVTGSSQQELLEQLQIEHNDSCPHCTQETGYTQTVFGAGNPCASLMFIGEAPGAEEDACGEPFVGAAGQKLNEIIQAIGLTREEVYIANVLKSRPPQNRTPLPTEIQACGPYLKKQIEIIQPDVIVTLGSPATKYILDTDQGITKIRGLWNSYNDIPVLPTYHPAYLLRNYTTEVRGQVWVDMQEVISKLP